MPTGQRLDKMLTLSVVKAGGDAIAEVRVSSRISVRQLRNIVKEVVKDIINLKFKAHDLVYEDIVLSLNKTLHASKIKNFSTLTYIDRSEFDDSGEEMPPLTDSSGEVDRLS